MNFFRYKNENSSPDWSRTFRFSKEAKASIPLLKFRFKNLYLLLILIILFSLTLNLIPCLLSGFYPTSPDSAGLACAVNKIGEREELGLGENFYLNFTTPWCWEEKAYPLNQIYTFNFKAISGFSSAKAVSILAIFLTTFIVVQIFFLAKDIFKRLDFAFLASLFAATSLSLARSLVLTPHNLFGYLIIIFIIWSLYKYQKTKKKIVLMPCFLSLFALIFYHQLSLAVISVVLFFYIIFSLKSRKLLLTSLIGLILIVILGSYFFAGTPNVFKLFYHLAKEGSSLGGLSSGSAHPLWDHPAALGYILSILGLLGLIVAIFNKNFPLKNLFIFLVVVPLGLANVYHLGLNILPGRFLAFAFIPLVILAPGALYYLYRHLQKVKILSYLFFITLFCLFLASTVHFLNYVQDDFHGFSKEILPNQDFIEAMDWLNDHSSEEDTVLTTTRKGANKFSTYIPYFYQGNLVAYPLFAFSHLNEFKSKNPKMEARFENKQIEPEGVIGSIASLFYKESEDEIKKTEANQSYSQELYNIFLMLNQPDQQEVLEIFNQYNIRYVMAWEGSHENQIYWSKGKKYFKRVYKNNLVNIYEREN